MNLTKIAIEKNRVTALILIIILFLGLTSYQELSRDSMPPFTIRVCTVVTQFPGASPERVEELVTDKIEKVVQELPELKTVTSESRTGLSIVSVTLTPDIVKADLVVSFQRPKLSFFFPESSEYIGDWKVADIGLNESFIHSLVSNCSML